MRQPQLALVALSAAIFFTAFAADDQTNFETILPGPTLTVPAPLGVTTDLLGPGFDERLDDLDAGGSGTVPSHRSSASSR